MDKKFDTNIIGVIEPETRLTNPDVAVSFGKFAIVYYRLDEASGAVPLPAYNKQGFEKPNFPEIPSDMQLAGFAKGLLTSNMPLAEIVQEHFANGLDIAEYSAKKMIERQRELKGLELRSDFAPSILIAVTGPADVGKSTTLAMLAEKGLPVISIDSKDALTHYRERLQQGDKPPFPEPRSIGSSDFNARASSQDVSAYSSESFRKIIKAMLHDLTSKQLIFLDGGGFALGNRSRPDSPLTALVRSSEIVIVMNRKGAFDLEQLALQNHGFGLVFDRHPRIFTSIGNVDESAERFGEYIMHDREGLIREALSNRLAFAEAVIDSIKDEGLKLAFVDKCGEFKNKYFSG